MTLVRTLSLAGILALAHVGPALAQSGAPLGPASTFAVIGGTSVTNTGPSVVNGDVGVFPGTTITGFPPGTLATGASQHPGDAVAAQAQEAAAAAYDDLDGRVCPAANQLTGDLGGKVLLPGVYCFETDATLTGALTLSGAGPWIFQVGGNLTVAPASTVVASVPGLACQGSGVFWQVGGASATIGGGSLFVGSLLAQNAVSAGAGSTIDGRLVSLDGPVSLESSTVTACVAGRVFPLTSAMGVTGGGQIFVPDPDSPDPEATGNGRANYGFNASPATTAAAANGHLNYLNHVTRLHINGPVTDVDVTEVGTDGLPTTVRFAGTCQIGPPCTWVALAEDHGEPGRDDRFGLLVVSGGAIVESRALRVVRNGNIQFHTSLTTDVAPRRDFRRGEVMRVSAMLQPGESASRVDAYVVLQMPNGQLMSWTGAALVPGLVPLARNITPGRFAGTILQTAIPPGTTPGTYKWMSGLTSPGTHNLVSAISETVFTIRP
jgi:hypothetical protein